MTVSKWILGAGVAALAAASPAAAQYGYGYASPYGYANQYGYANRYAVNTTQLATQQCSAAVQNRLANRNVMSGILGAVFGNSMSTGRVLSITRVNPNRNSVTVRGLATSGRMAGYGPYGVGAYGAAGYGYQPDLSFKCTVDHRGYVRDVDINRR